MSREGSGRRLGKGFGPGAGKGEGQGHVKGDRKGFGLGGGDNFAYDLECNFPFRNRSDLSPAELAVLENDLRHRGRHQSHRVPFHPEGAFERFFKPLNDAVKKGDFEAFMSLV